MACSSKLSLQRTDLYTLPHNTGDVGLEIAPGKDTENLDEIIEDVGNIWSALRDRRLGGKRGLRGMCG